MQATLAGSTLAPAFAFAVSFALLRLLLAPRAQRWLLDHPNQRSLHASPIPRTGGIAIVPGAVLGLLLARGQLLPAALAAGLMFLSVLDDWRHLPAAVRLLGHLAAAVIFILLAFPQLSTVWVLPLAIAVGWMTNLYNFMDGADGLAGGMALIGFSIYGLSALLSGQPAFALANFCVAASAAAFLLFNFNPARIFMGDAGSIPLGFLAGAFGLLGWRDGLWPLWFPIVVFGPFVVDASVTLAKRVWRHERVWEAHRSHYYQRLVLLGWSHRRLAVAEYALMLAGGGAGLAAAHLTGIGQALVLACLVCAYVVVMAAVDRRRQRQAF